MQGMGWQYRTLGAPVPVEDLVAMRINCLVLDLALLGPRAWEYLERVAESVPGLGVVVCTERSTVAQRVRGLRIGADDWVAKPCHPEEVIARVEAVVRRRRRGGAGAQGRGGGGGGGRGRGAAGGRPRATRAGRSWPASSRSEPTSSRPSSAVRAWTSRGASSSC